MRQRTRGGIRTVACRVTEEYQENENGVTVAGVLVECLRCHSTEFSFGTDSGSVKRCYALLRENCQSNIEYFYVDQKDMPKSRAQQIADRIDSLKDLS
jgi:hypothetical protein